ncbi:MAG: Crp/Fnr family transcriptional regulator [Arachidicoccus sp.]|nr:Crp/Fnr family transcriptional regulator [Arachidicoccus sp.]
MHSLILHIKNYIPVEDEEYESILQFFDTAELKKRDTILIEGQICKANYFIVKGCLRMFFINEKGVEQTTQFAIENWWISDNLSLLTQKPTAFHIQAVEKSEVLSIGNSSYQKLIQLHPSIESYFRMMHQRALGAAQYRMKYQHGMSREEIYRFFANSFPEFIQRIPQYLLASYLGFTPEYLSELRKKKIS